MRARRLILFVVTLATAATAGASTRDTARDERDLATALAGRVAGKPQNCIDQSRATGPESIGDHTVLYRQSGKRIWVNELRSACPALRSDHILVVHIFGSQLCERDRFEVINRPSSIPSGSCFFGPFTPYDKVAPAPK